MEKSSIFGLKIAMQEDIFCWSQCNNTAEQFFGLKVTMQENMICWSQGNNREKYCLLVSR